MQNMYRKSYMKRLTNFLYLKVSIKLFETTYKNVLQFTIKKSVFYTQLVTEINN